MNDPATLVWYQKQAPRYVSKICGSANAHLDPFLNRLPPGARILELGCGAGQDAAHMMKRGFAVDATDATDAMVALACGRGVPARQMRFDQLNAEQAYDAIWAHACLIHVARTDFAAVLARIYRALAPGGWHFANFKLGGGEGRDPLGRLHNFPDETWLREAYMAAGFEIAETQTYRGSGADGVVRDWHTLTLRKVS
ncbi:class I SAM-dependent methyltransferase [Tsuneonella sp. HG249]